MTNNDDLALKLKQTAQLVHDNEQISNYGKLEAWKVRFRHTASPANILALLAERDADKKRIDELTKWVNQAEARNDVKRAELCNQDEEVEMLRQRIAELERQEHYRVRQAVIDGLAASGECWDDIKEYMEKWDAEAAAAAPKQEE